MKIARSNGRNAYEWYLHSHSAARDIQPVLRPGISLLLSASLVLSSLSLEGCRKEAAKPGAPAGTAQQAPAATYAAPSADQLYELVAPIALFPDNLVAQVLAASTFPDQVAAADTWMQSNASLKGEQLMQAADQQPWDASVKAMTQFADVLHQMATSLAWTSDLGDAYFNIPQSVMNAIQVMRQRAQAAGNLKSNQQQTITAQQAAPQAEAAPASSGAPQTTIVQAPPQTIVIQPAQPEVVYVPQYNPEVVYGAPVASPPGYSTGAMVATGLISFGLGVAVGAAINNNNSCCGWGYNSWGCGWNNSTVVYNHNTYVSNSNTFVNRNNYNNANYNRNNANYNRANYNGANANNRANQNPNNRTNNFNQSRNQAEYRNVNADNLAGQNRQNPGGQTRDQAGQRPGEQQPRAGNLDQTQNRAGGNNQAQNRAGGNNQAQNRAGGNNQAQNRQQNVGGQTQRDASRGYGQEQGNRGTSNSAFSNYGEGGNARTNSARGQQSLGESQQAPAQRQNASFNQERSGGNASRPPQQQSRPEGHSGGGRRR
jgi:hypothetical protein